MNPTENILPPAHDFSAFFSAAFEDARHPYDYQSRLAQADCESRLISIPTGLGKTAAVVLAWLYNRVHLQRANWPRRLVYCLPMRALVEQTAAEAEQWIAELSKNNLLPGNPPQVVILMGGEENTDWDLYPEHDTILIGTQDMLLSRALNRGYGMSRYRWPMHFGLLNNDCLWVMDETQLMGVGVETSAQLDGFRTQREWQIQGSCPTWWMSATLEQTRLATVDHPIPVGGWPTATLSEEERTAGRAHELYEAEKAVSQCPLALTPSNKATYPKELATLIKARHKEGTLTLVVVNRVKRAREIYEVLTGGKRPLSEQSPVALIHSRFRPLDRARHTALLFGSGDRIVVATQAVEAGVDVSARLLISELAPWSSLVQRIGRCNRRADIPDAEVLWVDIQPKDQKDDLLLPYTLEGLDKSRTEISKLTDASPRILSGITASEDSVVRPIIRRRDLVDLFDTTPDLCGQDLDVSRYIRDGEDSDVQFFWRDIPSDAPTDNEPPPAREELCRVSIGEAASFLKKAEAWTWNPLDEKWVAAKKPRPGAVYLVKVCSGGYHDELGWTGDAKHRPTPHPPNGGINESYDANLRTYTGSWQTISEHTQLVVAETDAITSLVGLDASAAAALHTAALWHDVGKAHDEFQSMLRNGDTSREGFLWAKSEDKGGKCHRAGFRHELASAIAWLLAGPHEASARDLIAYLVAAHHGKVRLSIRSLPNEQAPADDRLFARGVWHGDVLPPLPDLTTASVSLDLSFMKMGAGEHGPSWLARTVALRDQLGPFRLAFLEMLLRAADARASRL